MRISFSAGLLAALTLSSSFAFAQAADPPAAAAPAKKEGTNSINLNPISLLIGTYGVGYEHLFDRTHGLLVEPAVSYQKDDNSKSTGYGGVVGYRWHWSHSQNSGFLGVNAGAYFGSGEATVTTSSGGVTNKQTFTVDTRSITVTGNVGRRFAWDNGFNITLRIGAGYGNYNVSTDSKDPNAKAAVELVDALLKIFPIALDGEASLGFIF